MKPYLNGLLVVEGKDDEALIKSFLHCYIYKTNGFDIKKEDIDFLNKVAKQHKIIILTDPDEAGEKIRNKINETIKENKYNIYINKETCIKNSKTGVAESQKVHILEQLKEFISNKPMEIGQITSYDLLNLGLGGDYLSKEKRKYLCSKLSLGICNQKTMLQRINLLNINKEELREALEEYGN